MLFKAKMLFSAAHGKRKPFCILISRFPHMLSLLPSWHVEKANHRSLQYVTAQLCRGALNLFDMKRTRLWWVLSSQTTFWSFRFLGHKYSSVCLHTYHLCGVIVHPPTQFLPFFMTAMPPTSEKYFSLQWGGRYLGILVGDNFSTFYYNCSIFLLRPFVSCHTHKLYTVNQMSECCGCLTVETWRWF